MTTEPDTDLTPLDPALDEPDTEFTEQLEPVHAMIEAPAASSGAGGQNL